MVEVIKRIDLCYSNASVILTPVQNDAGSRFLVASLTSEGEPYTIPEGCTVQLAVRKPDGTKTLTAASVKDNTVVCELTNQSLAVKGIADAQIIIYNGLAVLKTPPFKLNTFEQIVSDDTIVSTDVFTALSEIMKNYQEISAEVAKKLNKSGGVMSGNIDMGGNKIENIALPVADNDAASKKYVDDKTQAVGSGRLIYSEVLTEEVHTISISQDMENQNLNLKDVCVTFFIPASNNLPNFLYVSMTIYSQNNSYDYASYCRTPISGGTSGKYHSVVMQAKIKNNRWEINHGARLDAYATDIPATCEVTPSTIGYISNRRKLTDDRLAASKLLFSPTSTTANFPIGTKIEVYGI